MKKLFCLCITTLMLFGCLPDEKTTGLPVTLSQWAHDFQTADGAVLLHAQSGIPRVDADTAAAQAVNKHLDALQAEYQQRVQTMVDDLADIEIERTLQAELILNEICRNDEMILSFLLAEAADTGGPHESLSFIGVNFDAKTGAMLSLQDLVAPDVTMQELEQAIANRILAQIQAEPEGDYYADPAIIENLTAFTIGETGLTFYFAPYTIAPYTTGAPQFEIDASSHGGLTWLY